MLVITGIVSLVGLIKKALDKIKSENIDCNEFDKNLESVNNKNIKINLYSDSENNIVFDKVVIDDVVFSEIQDQDNIID